MCRPTHITCGKYSIHTGTLWLQAPYTSESDVLRVQISNPEEHGPAAALDLEINGNELKLYIFLADEDGVFTEEPQQITILDDIEQYARE